MLLLTQSMLSNMILKATPNWPMRARFWLSIGSSKTGLCSTLVAVLLYSVHSILPYIGLCYKYIINKRKWPHDVSVWAVGVDCGLGLGAADSLCMMAVTWYPFSTLNQPKTICYQCTYSSCDTNIHSFHPLIHIQSIHSALQWNIAPP